MKGKRLVTMALPYGNSGLHLGHIAGNALPADIFARYSRMAGYDVLFVGGTDMYGSPAEISAHTVGMDTGEFVDKIHSKQLEELTKFGISPDNYSKTTSKIHKKHVIDVYEKLLKKGYIKREEIDILFCSDIGALQDRLVKGTCPECGYKEAYGDGCEKCGVDLNPTELIDPYCGLCGSKPTLRKTKHDFFKMGDLSDKISKYIHQNKNVWRNFVYHQALNIAANWDSVDITRDIKWGIPVPELEEQVFYVWFDALLAYQSFTKEVGKYNEFWEDQSEIIHFMGKDNMKFHSVLWPAILMAMEDVNLPTNLVVQNHLKLEGKKFSKSKEWGVFCSNFLDMPSSEIDTFRSYLTSILPEKDDSDFSWTGYQNHVNGELIGKISNFFNRTLGIINNKYEGILNYDLTDNLNHTDLGLISDLEKISTEMTNNLENMKLRKAYRNLRSLAKAGNKYLETTEPWKLIQEGKSQSAKKSLLIALNLTRSISILANPFLPYSMDEFWKDQLNMPDSVHNQEWKSAQYLKIDGMHHIGKNKPIFSKVNNKGDRLEKLKKELSRVSTLEELVR